MSQVGVVIIGRNEGQRLLECLKSACAGESCVVYVDSGSRDRSVQAARETGATVVELDLDEPFTAARARNEGFARLSELAAEVEFVQFLDGDCVLDTGWIISAAGALENQVDVAVVCGKLRERSRGASSYNRLCDMEWQKTPGDIKACGGNFMVRTSAFSKVGGFDSTIIAAEDDELCLRLRGAGWRIVALDWDMATHDAAMTRFGQWWRRALRAGHAYAQGKALHGRSDERHFVRECRSIWFWGLILPTLSVGLAFWTDGMSLLLLMGYPVLGIRVYRYGRRRGWTSPDAKLYAFFTVLAKFPALLGMLKYHRHQWSGRRPQLIEYKSIQDPA